MTKARNAAPPPTIDEKTIKTQFLKACNLLMADRKHIAADCRMLADMLADTAALDEKISALQKEMETVVALNSAFIHSHNAKGENLEGFKKTTDEYDERYRKAEARLEKLQAERRERLARCQAVKRFIEDMLKQPLVLERWEDQTWSLLVKQAVVSADGTIEFTFLGENKITTRIG